MQMSAQLPSLLMQAARSAAEADGLVALDLPTNPSDGVRNGNNKANTSHNNSENEQAAAAGLAMVANSTTNDRTINNNVTNNNNSNNNPINAVMQQSANGVASNQSNQQQNRLNNNNSSTNYVVNASSHKSMTKGNMHSYVPKSGVAALADAAAAASVANIHRPPVSRQSPSFQPNNCPRQPQQQQQPQLLLTNSVNTPNTPNQQNSQALTYYHAPNKNNTNNGRPSSSNNNSMQPPSNIVPASQTPTLVSSNNSVSSNNNSGTNTPKTPSKKSATGPPLRRGKWTAEEEAYANRLILEFKAGLLPLTDGTTLRTFLSKLLNCDPMRISKKFVGSNCIGKQVFRRRTSDINRLTPEQINQNRRELSELERRFLERVAQTNRVKSNNGAGVSGTSSTAPSALTVKPNDDKTIPSSSSNQHNQNVNNGNSNGNTSKINRRHPGISPTLNPPWLRPPNGFHPGNNISGAGAGGTNSRAAAAGRALLQGAVGSKSDNKGVSNTKPKLTPSRSHGSAGLLALAALQRRKSQQSLLQNVVASALQKQNNNNSASSNSLFSAALAAGGNDISSAVGGLSSTAMAQIARNASAARLAGLAASDHSLNNLISKTGLSRDKLTQLARDQQLSSSSNSLSNLIERQSSYDALMSLDFQSLQSIDNLANLIQSSSAAGNLSQSQIPKSGMKNWNPPIGSNSNLATLANARRKASETRMESLIRTLSTGTVGMGNGSRSNLSTSSGSNANFGSLLQSMQNSSSNVSANSLFGSGTNLSSAMLQNLLRVESSTGLTNLRMQDGLNNRNSSVDDFLSLVASGDIPHQDPHLLNVPLHNVMQHQQQQQQQDSNSSQSGGSTTASYLAQQQLLAQAANNSSSALNSAMRLGLGNNSSSNNNNSRSASSIMSQLSSQSEQSSAVTNAAAAAFAQQQQQARAVQMNLNATALAAAARAQQQQHQSSNGVKRKLVENIGRVDGQGSAKRK